MDSAIDIAMKLTKKTLTAKDKKGCEFPYTVYSSYLYNDLPARHNELVQRLYVCEWYGIRADSLSELIDKMSAIE